MAKSKAPNKKKSPSKTPKPKRGGAGKRGSGTGGGQMGIGDFMQEQFEQRAGKKPKSGG